MKRIWILILLICSVVQAGEKEKKNVEITGAFGLKLGEVFNGSGKTSSIFADAWCKCQLENYPFEPKNKYDLLDIYTVHTSLKSHTIIRIIATNFCGNGCDSLYETLVSDIKKKYPVKNLKADKGKHVLFQNGKKAVSVGTNNGFVSLVYKDDNLCKLAREESKEMKNTKGL